MNRRLITSLVAGIVFVATYAVIAWERDGTVDTMELTVGGIGFFITFLLLRSWLDRRRDQSNKISYEEENKKDLSA